MRGGFLHNQVLIEPLDESFRRAGANTRREFAVRVGGRRWNLRFHGGTDVRLPETGAAEAWAQFARIERQHGVLQRDVDSIDLRLPDRLVVRTAPEEDPPVESDDGKNT